MENLVYLIQCLFYLFHRVHSDFLNVPHISFFLISSHILWPGYRCIYLLTFFKACGLGSFSSYVLLFLMNAHVSGKA